MIPSLQLQITHRTSTIEVRNLHSSSIRFIVDDFSTKHVLFLLAKAFKNMVWAHFHDGNFLVHALLELFSNGSCALLVLPDFTITTSWHEVWNQSHVLGVLHNGLIHTTLLCSECLVLPVRHPVVVRLVVLMVLVQGVIQVTVEPPELWDNTKIEWHLGVIIRLVIVSGSDWIDFLVDIRMDNRITPIVVRFLPVVFWNVRRVEIDHRHIYYK